MTCCDTCPFAPTCEEIDDFHRAVWALAEDWGEEYGDDEAPSST